MGQLGWKIGEQRLSLELAQTEHPVIIVILLLLARARHEIRGKWKRIVTETYFLTLYSQLKLSIRTN